MIIGLWVRAQYCLKESCVESNFVKKLHSFARLADLKRTWYQVIFKLESMFRFLYCLLD